ncbi:hypothetical protein [Streptomyces sp. NPDC015125]|uniref:hypothetical protein n=1 Tax=Streptomyces sp. NPDC015125 TaxID=3364938 RepID=UPI0036FD7662
MTDPSDQFMIPPSLLEDLRTALVRHFATADRLPDAVDFRITEEHPHLESLAWAGDGALLIYGSAKEPTDDLAEAVGDELDALSEFRASRFGDTLLVGLSAAYMPSPPDAADDAPSRTFDPQSPYAFLDARDDTVLDRIETALYAVRRERTQRRFEETVVAALPQLAQEEWLDSASPVARVVFRALPGEWEEGPRWPFLASAHHADGSVTIDLDFDEYIGDLLAPMDEWVPASEGEHMVVVVPGVALHVEPCVVCDDTACGDKSGHAFTTCAVCPEPYRLMHQAHPQPGCPGFSALPVRPGA